MRAMTSDERSVFAETLRTGTESLGLSLSESQQEDCLRYTEHLLTVNAHTNLTRITDPAAIAIKHFADSLTVLKAVPDIPNGATVADVGTGAGFPGVVLKIVRPDLNLTLLDSLGKRLTFLREVADLLGFANVSFVHIRAEDAGQDRAHRDRYALVTARAVAALPTLLEWCGPLTRVGGRFVAMKAESADTELSAATEAARILHLRLTHDEALALPAVPGEDAPSTRRLLVYEKLRATPPVYPRRPAEIKAKPL
jgi:16S rRNA (guanine527-N7)-methyltransferase